MKLCKFINNNKIECYDLDLGIEKIINGRQKFVKYITYQKDGKDMVCSNPSENMLRQLGYKNLVLDTKQYNFDKNTQYLMRYYVDGVEIYEKHYIMDIIEV